MITICLLSGFFLVFFPWVIFLKGTIVNSNLQHGTKGFEKKNFEIWIRISGFELQVANHHTVEPTMVHEVLTLSELLPWWAFVLFLSWLAFACYLDSSLILFRWLVSFLANIVNLNLQHRTKDIELKVLPRFELGSSDSESEVLTTKSYNLSAFKTSLCCVSCYCWCVFWSWTAFAG